MEGIMNLPANVGGATSQDGLDSFAPLIASQQTARDIGYPRFVRELLAAGAEVDPAEIETFLQEIRSAGMGPEDVAMLRRVVEAVFNDPNNYPVVREQLLSEGIPEDILPETFDLEFFVALRIAVEEGENLVRESGPTDQDMPMDMPVEMAQGGIVSSIRSVLDRMREQPLPVNTGEFRGGITSSLRSVLDRMREQPAPVVNNNPRGLFKGLFNNKLLRDARESALKKELESRQQSRQELLDRMRQQYPALFGSLTPVSMAEGGIVDLPQMTPIAREMAALGRNGDTMLAHITPQEAMMLQRMGGSGTINPYTGLPEFFLKKVFKAVSKPFKAVGKAVKKFASSTVGRLVVTVALGAFLGPAAAGFLGVSSAAGVAAVTGFVGSFGSGILAGDGLKNSLRNGLTGAALAGGISAVAGGSAALQARPEFAQSYKDAGGFLGNVRQTASNFFASPSAEAQRVFGTGETMSQEAIPEISTATDISRVTPSTEAISAQTANAPFLADKAIDPTTLNYADQAFGTQIGAGFPTSQQFPQGPFPMSGVAPSSVQVPASLNAPTQIQPVSPANAATTVAAPATTGAGAIVPKGAVAPQVAESTFLGRTGDFLKDPSLSGFGDIFVDPNATGLARYKPAMYAGGIGLLATQGDKLFEVPEQEPGESYEAYMARRQAAEAQFRQERPEFFGSLLASPNQGIMSTQPSYSFQPVYTAARGSGPQGVEDFPRKNGHISGPGTGTSDDIPAMLSDGEFVFTAQSVRNMGNGSRRKGAARMYKMMKMLEGGPVGKTAKA